MMERTLEDLKAGDEAIVKDICNDYIVQIVKVTKTQITTTYRKNGTPTRWNKSDGLRFGIDDFAWLPCLDASLERLERTRNEKEREIIIGEISAMFPVMSLSTLKAVKALIKESGSAEEKEEEKNDE
jgi:hypothetical protein